MAWVALAALAFASDEAPALEVTVERAPLRPPAKSDPPWTGTLTLGRGTVALDGRLDEAAWAEASAPPFGPHADGPAPTDATLRAAWADDGLALAVVGLDPAESARVLVNPDGLQSRWWVATVRPNAVEWQVCDYGGRMLSVEVAASPDAAPCAPTDAPRAAGGEGTWEILLPTSAGARFTALGRLDAVVYGPNRGGGRWGPGGREPNALGGLSLAPDAPPVTVTPTLDLEARRLRATVAVPPGLAWTWRLVYRDVTVASGAVDLAEGATTGAFEADLPPLQRLALVVEATTGDPPPAGLRWTAFEYAATLSTPVFADRVSIAVRTSAPVRDVPVEVVGADGSLVGRATVTLPTGPSVVHVAVGPDWPEAVRVRVGHLADLAALRERP